MPRIVVLTVCLLLCPSLCLAVIAEEAPFEQPSAARLAAKTAALEKQSLQGERTIPGIARLEEKIAMPPAAASQLKTTEDNTLAPADNSSHTTEAYNVPPRELPTQTPAAETVFSNANASGQGTEKISTGKNLWNRFSRRLTQTWNSSTIDLYVPAYTWHNRLMYDSSRANKYNENPWGVGIGKSFIDEDGDWHALYYMGFQDSHDMYEPMIGYGYQKIWRPVEGQDFRLGLGATAGLTARQQYSYVPLPLVLPIFGVEYKKAAVQATYIPGGYNDGNVLFCWLRFQLN